MPTLFADFMTSYNESTTYLKGSGKVRLTACKGKLQTSFADGILNIAISGPLVRIDFGTAERAPEFRAAR